MNKTIADLLAFVVDPLFAAKGPQGALDTWTAVLAFAGQVYGDFCGYTDVATGIALLLGFTPAAELRAAVPVAIAGRVLEALAHLVVDAGSATTSTSPLARRSLELSLFALAYADDVPRLASGHGAAWNSSRFWGVYHGTHLVAYRVFIEVRRMAAQQEVSRRRSRSGSGSLTTYLVFVGFAMFRAESVGSMLEILREMHAPTEPSELTHAAAMTLLLVVAGLVLGHGLSWMGRDPSGRVRRSGLFWPAVTLLFAMSFAMGRIGHTFLYFQFLTGGLTSGRSAASQCSTSPTGANEVKSVVGPRRR